MIDQFALHAVAALPRAWALAMSEAALDAWWLAGDHARVYAVARARFDFGWTLAFYRAFDPDAERARQIARELVALRPVDVASLLTLARDPDLHDAIFDAVDLRDTRAQVAKIVTGEFDPDAYADNEVVVRAFGCAARPDRAERFPDIWTLVYQTSHVEAILLALHAAPGDGFALVPEEHHAAARRVALLAGNAALAARFATDADEPTLTADGLAEAATAAAATATTLAARFLDPLPAEPPSERQRKSVLEAVQAVATDRTRLGRALRAIANTGKRGHGALAGEAFLALEAITGSLTGTTMWRLAPAMSYAPGRAHDAAAALDLPVAYEVAAVAAAFHRDGDHTEAAAHANRALAEPLFALDDGGIALLSPLVLRDAAARERVAALLDATLANIPRTADWPLAPLIEPFPVVRSPELEAQLAADPDDATTILVYADFLTQHGDPRGELVALQRDGREAEATLLLARHPHHFLGELAGYAVSLDGTNRQGFTWRDGFLSRARLGYQNHHAERRGRRDDSLARAVELVLAHPSAALLRELVLAVAFDDGWDLAPAIAAVARTDRPPLRTLQLGEFSFNGASARAGISSGMDFEISWATMPDLRALWPRLPNLRHLGILGALEDDVLGDLSQLAHLESLAIRSGGVRAENLRALAAARLPKLTSLELWTGSSEYGFTGDVDDLLPILAGANLPALRSLRIMNSELADALIEPLARSAILPRLATLGLAMGTLTDDGAALLHAHADAFAHLELLELDDNYLSEDSGDVESLAAEVWCTSDKDPNDDERYVSVGE